MITDFVSIADVTERNDNALAKRFIGNYYQRLRYVVTWRKWLAWTGRKWCLTTGDDRAMQLSRFHAEDLWHEHAQIAIDTSISTDEKQAVLSLVKQANDTKRIENVVKLSRHDGRVSITHDELDSDPYLLNLVNGTFDLKSMEFREHRQEDLVTQIANVRFSRDAKCPLWLETLELIFAGDADLIAYLQTILGYCLSGDIGEHILPIAFGNGANGKSTVWNVMIGILGDYATLANDSLLLGAKDNHPTEKAALYQKRFVPISEPERGAKMKESRVKELTGDGMITARRMKEDFWTFRRTHKFFLATNHLPKVDGTDEGIWRRLKIIPFKVDLRKATTPVTDMVDQLLKTEASGILNWLLAGWKRFRDTQQIVEPMSVKQATSTYRSDSDALGQWIEEYCVVGDDAVATAQELFDRYLLTGGKWSQTIFGKALAERFEKVKPQSGKFRKKWIYQGVRLATESDENCDYPEENAECPHLPPVRGLEPRETPVRELTAEPGATGGKADFKTCQCGSRMVSTELFGGIQTWYCPQCKAAVDRPVEVVQ